MTRLRDAYCRAVSWITTRPSWPRFHSKCPEAAQLHSIASGEGGFDLMKNGIDDLFSVLVVQMRILRALANPSTNSDLIMQPSHPKGCSRGP